MATCSDSTLTQVASPPTPVAISPIAASSDTPMSSSVTCPDCSKTFLTRSGLSRHVKKKHPENETVTSNHLGCHLCASQ